MRNFPSVETFGFYAILFILNTLNKIVSKVQTFANTTYIARVQTFIHTSLYLKSLNKSLENPVLQFISSLVHSWQVIPVFTVARVKVLLHY